VPEGRWIDLLSGRRFAGVAPLPALLASFPAAVLMLQDSDGLRSD
jgi:hypothetical protein